MPICDFKKINVAFFNFAKRRNPKNDLTVVTETPAPTTHTDLAPISVQKFSKITEHFKSPYQKPKPASISKTYTKQSQTAVIVAARVRPKSKDEERKKEKSVLHKEWSHINLASNTKEKHAFICYYVDLSTSEEEEESSTKKAKRAKKGMYLYYQLYY